MGFTGSSQSSNSMLTTAMAIRRERAVAMAPTLLGYSSCHNGTPVGFAASVQACFESAVMCHGAMFGAIRSWERFTAIAAAKTFCTHTLGLRPAFFLAAALIETVHENMLCNELAFFFTGRWMRWLVAITLEHTDVQCSFGLERANLWRASIIQTADQNSMRRKRAPGLAGTIVNNLTTAQTVTEEALGMSCAILGISPIFNNGCNTGCLHPL